MSSRHSVIWPYSDNGVADDNNHDIQYERGCVCYEGDSYEFVDKEHDPHEPLRRGQYHLESQEHEIASLWGGR